MNFYCIFGLFVVALCSGSRLCPRLIPAFHGGDGDSGYDRSCVVHGPDRLRHKVRTRSEVPDSLERGGDISLKGHGRREDGQRLAGILGSSISNGGSFWHLNATFRLQWQDNGRDETTVEKQTPVLARCRHQGNWWFDGSVVRGSSMTRSRLLRPMFTLGTSRVVHAGIQRKSVLPTAQPPHAAHPLVLADHHALADEIHHQRADPCSRVISECERTQQRGLLDAISPKLRGAWTTRQTSPRRCP